MEGLGATRCFRKCLQTSRGEYTRRGRPHFDNGADYIKRGRLHLRSSADHVNVLWQALVLRAVAENVSELAGVVIYVYMYIQIRRCTSIFQKT